MDKKTMDKYRKSFKEASCSKEDLLTRMQDVRKRFNRPEEMDKVIIFKENKGTDRKETEK